jgi:hypothetical protein
MNIKNLLKKWGIKIIAILIAVFMIGTGFVYMLSKILG